MRGDRQMLPGDIVRPSPKVGRAAVHDVLPSLGRPVAVLGYDEVAMIVSTVALKTWMGNDGLRACLVLLPHTCTVGWTYEDELERVG